MSEPRAVYHSEATPLGYMPLPEVYAALDFVLNAARSEALAVDPGKVFLSTWLLAGPLPSKAAIEQNRHAMGEQIDALTAAFRDTLTSFVEQLADHPCPMPGTPFGDYYAELVELQSAAES